MHDGHTTETGGYGKLLSSFLFLGGMWNMVGHRQQNGTEREPFVEMVGRRMQKAWSTYIQRDMEICGVRIMFVSLLMCYATGSLQASRPRFFFKSVGFL